MNFTDLPVDILLLIIPYLSAPDFLRLCSTTPIFQHEPELRYSAAYWSSLTKHTFRVPNQPVVEADGRRWSALYRRMRTQTKVYTWGNNDKGCLGTAWQPRHQAGSPPLPPTGGVAWPWEIILTHVGVIADLQAGGWSIAVLNDKGQLYVQGVIAGLRAARPIPRCRPLTYPPGFSPPMDYYTSNTAIKQFSVGRSHILGLSDSGRIWSWDDAECQGLNVKFLTVDLVEKQSSGLSSVLGRVKRVVAGWGRSTALVNGRGIVVWEPVNNRKILGEQQSEHDDVDTAFVTGNWLVPETEYYSERKKSIFNMREKQLDELGRRVGEVVNHAVLSDFIIFVTHLGKVFAAKIPTNGQEILNKTFEVTTRTRDPFSIPDENEFVLDIQGSNFSFAVFQRNGDVLTADENYLHTLWSTQSASPLPSKVTPTNTLRKIPALQSTGVISIAFGDYHFHALHSDGTISSYGSEPQGCGALGLGNESVKNMRGFHPSRFDRNSDLMKETAATGRRVCFEEEKRRYLDHFRLGGANRTEAEARIGECFTRDEVRAEVSEWIEQKLRHWEEGEGLDVHDEQQDAGDGLPAYFSLSVAAAGWHSGALVLINEAKAEKVRRRHLRCTTAKSSTCAESAPLELDQEPGAAGVEQQPAAAPEGHSTTDGFVAGTLSTLTRLVRWFLGLPTSADTARLTLRGEGNRNHAAAPAIEGEHWIWEDETFPRLRLRSGRVLPGSVPVTEWNPPPWKDVELVEI